jgi:chromosome segregation ATPase
MIFGVSWSTALGLIIFGALLGLLVGWLIERLNRGKRQALETRMLELEQTNSRVQTELTSANRQLQELHIDLSQLRGEYDTTFNQLQIANTTVTERGQQIDALQTQQATLSAKIQRTNEQIDAFYTAADQRKAWLASLLQLSRQPITDEQAVLPTNDDADHDAVTQLYVAIDSLRSERDQLRSDYDRLTSQLQQEQTQRTSEYGALQREISTLRTANEQHQTWLNELGNLAHAADADATPLPLGTSDNQGTLEALRAKIIALHNDNQRLQLEVSSLTSAPTANQGEEQPATSGTERKGWFSNLLDLARGATSSAPSSSSATNEDDAGIDLDQLHTTLLDLQQENDDLKRTADQRKRAWEDLSDQHQQLSSQFETLNADLALRLSEIDTLNSELTGMYSQTRSLQGEIERLKAEIGAANNAWQSVQPHLDDLGTRLTTITTERDQLLRTLESSQTATTNEINELRTALTTLRDEFHFMHESRDIHAQALNASRYERDHLLVELQRLHDLIKTLEAERVLANPVSETTQPSSEAPNQAVLPTTTDEAPTVVSTQQPEDTSRSTR